MEDGDVPTMNQVLTVATVGGAQTTAFGGHLGTLEVGTAADLVLLDWQQISYPYLDEETPVLDAVIQRAKTGGVRHVICGGETIYADGRFTRVDQAGAFKALLPHIRRFYAGYMGPAEHQPFYRPSSMA